jgi:hypothetical protein
MTPNVEHRFLEVMSPGVAVITILGCCSESHAEGRAHGLTRYADVDKFAVDGEGVQFWAFARG